MFQIDIVDTHSKRPPTLLVDVNGETVRKHLERGAGDIAFMRPEKGKARTA